MALDSTLIVGLIAATAAIGGSAITVLTAKITSGPVEDTALTDRFTALIDRQEQERKNLVEEYDRREAKLERVAGDLESMVIKFLEWADEVTIEAERRGVPLPPRPKFPHVGSAPR